MLIKFRDGDAIVFLESGGGGLLSFKMIADYFNSFLSEYNSSSSVNIVSRLIFDMIPSDGFKEVLDGMRRVICADVYMDKQILGGNSLNFSEYMMEVQDTVELKISAKRGESIKNYVYNILAKLNGGNSKIKKIRVRGRQSNDNECVIDTDFVIKKDYIDAQKNADTGEYNSIYMFSQLKELSNRY